jgi:DNA (cytosine-5)-methyltransferase 3A
MKKESQDVISKYLGCEPIEINSALVSAQNRRRLYWTNIPGIKQPEDKNILLKDVLEDGLNNGAAIRGRYNENGKIIQKLEPRKDNKTNSLTTVQKDNVVLLDFNHTEKALKYMNRKIKDGRTHWDFGYVHSLDRDKSQSITANTHKGVPYNVLVDFKPKAGEIKESPKVFRNLTPVEVERLQTVPDNYTDSVSNSQRYKMLGNGWTVDVIVHILKNMI